MADITVTEVASAIPTIIAMEALSRLNANTVMAPLVYRDYSTEIAKSGNTVSVQKRGALTVNDKSANTDVTLQTPSTSAVSVVLNKHKEVSFLIEDIAMAMSRPDLLTGYAQDAALALGEQIDSDLLSLATTATNYVGTAGTSVTAAVLRSARKKLNDNKAPVTDRHVIVSSKDEDNLLGDADVRQAYAFGENVQQNGQLRQLWGFTPHMSQLVATSGSSPVTTWNIAFHGLGIALVTRPLAPAPTGYGVSQSTVTANDVVIRTTMSYDPSKLGYLVTFDVLYGVAVLRHELICAVKG